MSSDTDGVTTPSLSRRTVVHGAVLGIAAAAVSSIGQVLAAEKNLKFGTWKLNLERSKGGAGRTSEIRVYADAGDGFMSSTRDTAFADGRKQHAFYKAKPDNKEYPIVDENGKQTGTFAYIHENGTDKFTTRPAAGGQTTGETTPSADGKTLTMILRSGGNETINIYDRVK
jgi:hypothetical protein